MTVKNVKQTSNRVSHLAATTLANPSTSSTAKSLAGSALAQHHSKKQTGSKIEGLAGKVLQSDKYAKATKTLAGSVVSQANKKR